MLNPYACMHNLSGQLYLLRAKFLKDKNYYYSVKHSNGIIIGGLQ